MIGASLAASSRSSTAGSSCIMRDRSTALSTSPTTAAALDFAAGVGRRDALRQRARPPRARSASTSYSAQHLRQRRQADASRRAHSISARAVVLEQQRVRLGEGVGQGMAGAHGSRARAVGGRRRLSGSPAAAAARRRRRRAGACSSGAAAAAASRQRRQHRRSLIGSSTLGVRLHVLLLARGSGRSGRARACSAVSASRITTGRRNTIRLVALAVRALAAEQAPTTGCRRAAAPSILLSV